jgi:hypothetical protein
MLTQNDTEFDDEASEQLLTGFYWLPVCEVTEIVAGSAFNAQRTEQRKFFLSQSHMKSEQ